jgi:hypothetical protein
MAQQMITLEEAATRLGITPEEMKKRLKTDADFKRLSQIRDGATVRFKLAAIEELARELGLSSEADLPLAPLAEEEEPGSDDFKVPAADKKKPKKPADDEVLLDFGSDGSDEVFSLADDPKPASPKSSAKLTPAKPPKGPSDSSTDSDVRLDTGKPKKAKPGEEGVPTEEIALDFSGPGSAVIKGGSSAKLSAPKTGGSSGKLSMPEVSLPKTGKSSGEVNLPKGGPKSSAALNLDLDKKPDPKKSDAKKSDVKKKSDANRAAPGAKKKSDLIRGDGPPADSSEFELSLDADSDDFELQMSDSSTGADDVDLSTMPKGGPGGPRGSKSGINLRDPADSGISLEKKTGPKGDTTDKPAGDKSKAAKTDKGSKGSVGSMSDSSDTNSAEPSSDVDFELSLDSSAAASASKLGAPKSGKLVLDSESDSEFELTLDDSSSSSLEQAALGADALEESSDKGDIFETDFEIPPMPEESGSEAVAIDSDSDLEKSDFELASDDSDVVAEGDADALAEEEEAPKPKPAAKAAKPKKVVSEAEVDLEEVTDEEDEGSAAAALKGAKGKRVTDDDEDEEAVPAGAMVERPTKPWGVLPALFLAPTFFVVLLGLLMGYEMLQTMWGYQQPRKPTAPIIRGLAQNLDMDLKDQ